MTRAAPPVALALALVAGCAEDANNVRSSEPEPTGRVAVLPASPFEGDADVAPDAAPAGDDAGSVVPRVVLEDPMDGAIFVQDAIEDGAWVARVPLRVTASGVVRVELVADGGATLATFDAPPYEAVRSFVRAGTRTVTARGLDAGGVEVARDEATITIEPPTDTGCHAMLDALGLDWAVAGPTMGIADPVRVQPVIDGVRFRYVENATPTAMLMDCSLAPRLVRLAALVTTYGLDEVIHLGIYNYRCIGGGDPSTGCTPSQHAYAKAIDLHAFGLAASDVEYSTELDWVITTGDVCPGTPSSEADRVLHELACAMWSTRMFQIVLTPDYNAAHRNHFHVDLTEGSMFIGETVHGIDPILPGLGD